MANYTSTHTGNEIDLAIQSGSTVSGKILSTGDISSSAVMYASQSVVDGGDNTVTPAHGMGLTVKGHISASGTVYADNFQSVGGDDQITFDDNLYVSGHITASGNISASGHITASGLYSVDDISLGNNKKIYFRDTAEQTQFIKGGSNYLTLDGDNQLNFYADTDSRFVAGNVGIGNFSTTTAKLHVMGDIWASGSGGHITASGNISGSATSTGSFANVHAGTITITHGADGTDRSAYPGNFYMGSNNIIKTDDVLHVGGNSLNVDNNAFLWNGVKNQFTVDGQITASGNISSSGNISALTGTITADNYGGNISGSITSTGSFGSLISRTTYIGDSTPIFNEGANMLIIDSNDAQMLSLRRNNQVNQWNFGISSAGNLDIRERTADSGTGTTRVVFLKTGGAQFNSHITASGNISSSGIITGEGLVISDDALITDDLEVHGNISGSITSTGSFGRIILNDTAPIIGNNGAIVKGASASTGVNFRARNGNGNDRFRVHGYGNLAIGGDSGDTGATTLHLRYIASALLNTNTGINEYIRLEDNSNKSGSIGLGANGNLQFLSQGGTTSLIANTAGIGNFTVAGKVHIGSGNTPANELQVVGTIAASGNISASGDFFLEGDSVVDGSGSFGGANSSSAALTVKGDISASGQLYAAALPTSDPGFLGALFTTGSGVGGATSQLGGITGSGALIVMVSQG